LPNRFSGFDNTPFTPNPGVYPHPPQLQRPVTTGQMKYGKQRTVPIPTPVHPQVQDTGIFNTQTFLRSRGYQINPNGIMDEATRKAIADWHTKSANIFAVNHAPPQHTAPAHTVGAQNPHPQGEQPTAPVQPNPTTNVDDALAKILAQTITPPSSQGSAATTPNINWSQLLQAAGQGMTNPSAPNFPNVFKGMSMGSGQVNPMQYATAMANLQYGPQMAEILRQRSNLLSAEPQGQGNISNYFRPVEQQAAANVDANQQAAQGAVGASNSATSGILGALGGGGGAASAIAQGGQNATQALQSLGLTQGAADRDMVRGTKRDEAVAHTNLQANVNQNVQDLSGQLLEQLANRQNSVVQNYGQGLQINDQMKNSDTQRRTALLNGLITKALAGSQVQGAKIDNVTKLLNNKLNVANFGLQSQKTNADINQGQQALDNTSKNIQLGVAKLKLDAVKTSVDAGKAADTAAAASTKNAIDSRKASIEARKADIAQQKVNLERAKANAKKGWGALKVDDYSSLGSSLLQPFIDQQDSKQRPDGSIVTDDAGNPIDNPYKGRLHSSPQIAYEGILEQIVTQYNLPFDAHAKALAAGLVVKAMTHSRYAGNWKFNGTKFVRKAG
jgi:hypothetical protein